MVVVMNKITHALMSILFTPVYQDQDVLICYASQTGTAANLAAQSGNIARQMGRSVKVSSLSSLKPSDFNTYKQVLMIVSTCGEGEIPDDGKLFYEQLKAFPSLSTPISLFALGDQSYTHFCLAGQLMHEELKRMGAVREETPTMVSGNPTETWRDWLSVQLDQVIEKDQTTPLYTPVTLALTARRPLHSMTTKDVGSANQAYHLTFDLVHEKNEAYKVNDLIGITPPGSDKERLYSIASSPSVNPNQLSLCIAKHQFILNGGLCSDYLIEQLNVGQAFKASLKSGAGMPLPNRETPSILIATGAGIAPMMSMLEERKQQQHSGQNWLLFGNRYSDRDFYYQQALNQYVSDGTLSQLDCAFSRDSEQKVYVQDKLKSKQEQLAKWLLNQNAQLYVCGRPELKQEILAIVTLSLETALQSRQEAETKVHTMLKNKQITFELF